MLNEQFDADEYFLQEFEKNISRLDDDIKVDNGLVEKMCLQAANILPHIDEAVKKRFGDFEVVSTEEELMVPIEGVNYNFKGFIDLVLKTSDGKHHIIDWKTCSWGWNYRKRSDPMVTYQLTLYKKYYAIKHGVDPSNIETHFALLKRTAKNNNVEFVSVTSGEVKTNNATKLLMLAISNIQKSKYIKNRLSCKGCQFYKTEHCP
jgi:RecB family exonuclease